MGFLQGRLIIGDSNETVPAYHAKNPNERYDLMHIDGNHVVEAANIDFHNCYPLANKHIIWNDTQDINLNRLINGYIKDGYAFEYPLYKTESYRHRIMIKNPLIGKIYTWQVRESGRTDHDFDIEFAQKAVLKDGKPIGFYQIINSNLLRLTIWKTGHIVSNFYQYDKNICKPNMVSNRVVDGQVHKLKLKTK